MNAQSTCRARTRGFSLIELIVVIAIAAVLLRIAIPSYLTYVEKARRPEAKTALLDLAAREERFYTQNNYYTADATLLGYASAFPVNLGGGPDYQLSVTAPGAGVKGTTYTLQAAAVNGQGSDSCGTFTLDNLGNQTPTTVGCW
jgi:type IV pilus assembly protein PilE